MKKALHIVTFTMIFTINCPAQWTQRASFPGTSRAKATSFLIGDTIYVIGGVNNSSLILRDFWAYDIQSNVWTHKSNFPGQERYGAAGFVINNKGYIATGGNDNGFLDDLWQYNPSTGTWVEKTGLPATMAQHENQRTETYSFVVGNKAYLGGGNGFVFGANQTTNIAFYDLWEYNPVSDSWAQKADETDFIGRNMSVAVAINGKGYIGLGCDVDQTTNRQSFWEYNPATNTWTAKAGFPALATTDGATFVFNNEMYVVGGVRLSPINLSNEVYKYDPVTDTWTQLANFNGGAIAGPIAASNGTKAFVSTGYNASVITRSDTWELTVATGIAENFSQGNLNIYPNPSSDFISINSEKKITKIEVFDITGKMKLTATENRVDIQEFSAGLYWVKIIFKDGSEENQRILKSN